VLAWRRTARYAAWRRRMARKASMRLARGSAASGTPLWRHRGGIAFMVRSHIFLETHLPHSYLLFKTSSIPSPSLRLPAHHICSIFLAAVCLPAAPLYLAAKRTACLLPLRRNIACRAASAVFALCAALPSLTPSPTPGLVLCLPLLCTRSKDENGNGASLLMPLHSGIGLA